VAALVLLAALVRYQNLWLEPRLTDEWREVDRGLLIVAEHRLPLTNYDAYIGALWNYLLAAAFLLGGPDPRLPRLLMLAIGSLTIVPTYLLGRELGGPRAGLVAAALLVTSPVHVLVNSHVAWSHCTTPLFTTAGCWLLVGAARRARGTPGDQRSPAVPAGPRWLALAGLAFGLAFQTHPTALALVPGAAAYLWLRGRPLLRPRALLPAAALFLVGCSNYLVATALDPHSYVASVRSIQDTYALRHRPPLLEFYLVNLKFFVLSLLRLPGGVALDTLDLSQVLLQPVVWAEALVLGWGALVAARRGVPLALCLVAPAAVLMSLFQPGSYYPVPDGRYAMPLLPPLYASLALALVRPPGWLAPRRAALLFAALALVPLACLQQYYLAHAHELAEYRALWDGLVEIDRSGLVGAPVVVDERLGDHLNDYARRNALGLLWDAGFDARFERVDLRPPAPRGTLYVLSCRNYHLARERLDLVPLDPSDGGACEGVRAARAPEPVAALGPPAAE